jgi:transcriptional regulator with XRE-family HTH domain
MGRKSSQPSPVIEDILAQLGEKIKLARLRRKITTIMLSERAGMTRSTLRSIERGDGNVSMNSYAMVLFCLGLDQDLLLIAEDDLLGRKLQDAALTQPKQRAPKRVKDE